MIDTQLLILTWHQDLNWLNACLRGVERYWRASRPPFIVATPECETIMPKVVSELGCQVKYVRQEGDSRFGQQYLKMIADTYVQADAILYTDSDCMFTRECTAEDFCIDGKPLVVTERYDNILPTAIEPDRICLEGYRRAAKSLIDYYPEHEFMRRHPFFFYRNSVTNLRKHIEHNAGTALEPAMRQFNSGQISEFNLMGAFCYNFERGRYYFTDTHEAPPQLIRQFHSWSQDPSTQETAWVWKLIIKDHRWQESQLAGWTIDGVQVEVQQILEGTHWMNHSNNRESENIKRQVMPTTLNRTKEGEIMIPKEHAALHTENREESSETISLSVS
jgi:hypothetical protein